MLALPQIVFSIQSTLPKRADPQDALQILKLVAANDIGGAVAWNFTLSNWPTLIYEQGWPCVLHLMSLPRLTFFVEREMGVVRSMLRRHSLAC